MKDLCWGCKAFKDIVYTEGGTDHPFCAGCSELQPPTSEEVAVLMLTAPNSPWGPPFRPGDQVEARTGAVIFDGVGTVAEMSMSLEHGATPIYPTWRVVLDSKAHDQAPDEAWYTEVCLKRVTDKEDSKRD